MAGSHVLTEDADVTQGWGHASENPKLPATLAHHNIIFIGPAAEAMDAVGDKA